MTEPLLHHRLDGDGRHVLLLHPVGLDLTFFDPLVALLTSRGRVLRADLRGHGCTRPSRRPQELADHAADLHALLASLHFGPVVVAGFSLGGMLAQLLAIDYPENVSALVLGACPSTLPDVTRRALVERSTLAEREGMPAVVDATLNRWFTAPFRRAGLAEPVRRRLLDDDVGTWAGMWTAMARFETATKLASIAVPTLCLAGELDVSLPPEVVAGIAARIPGARFVTIPGAPHMLFIEQPAPVAAAILSFLDALP